MQQRPALAVGLTFQPPIERMTLSRGFWALKPTIVGMNSLSFASTLLFTATVGRQSRQESQPVLQLT